MDKGMKEGDMAHQHADDCNSHRVLHMQDTIDTLPNLLVAIIIVLFIVLRKADLFGKPYLWAEDATIFLTRAAQNGIHAIGETYAGYYHIVPQGVTLLAVWISELATGGIRIAPYIMYGIALVWSGFVFLYFALGNFDWFVVGKWRRTCVCLLTILFIPSETSEVWFTITNFQWWAEVFLFLVGLCMVNSWEMPKSKLVLPVLVIIGLSTPVGGLILPVAIVVCIVRWRRQVLTGADLLSLVALMVPIAFQMIAVLGPGEGRTLIHLGTLVDLFFKYFISRLPQMVFPNTSALVGNWNQPFTCVLFWLPLLYLFMCCKEIRISIAYGVLYMSTAAALFILTAVDGESTFNAGRYSFAIISIWMILIISGAFKTLGQEKKTENDLSRSALPIVLMASLCILPYRQLPISADLADTWKGIEEYMETGTERHCWASVAPGWPWGVWGMEIPIQTRYLQAEPSEDIMYAVDYLGEKGSAEALTEGLTINGQGGLSITGWAMESNEPVTVLVEANGNYVATRPINRKDVADYLEIPSQGETFYAGYETVIPASDLIEGENQIKLVLISEDEQNCNQIPLTVKIHEIA